ncbi:MAG: PIN domain nuclease [Rhodocyclaceae bacterium]|nr:PIN domain nuclease [Rhodocyclaceae bacterium]MDZ4215462.1 PIN domain nuclease [Rhodocyclaceae bacterium]
MILADASVWIDFFNGREGVAVDRLADLLDDGAAPLEMADLTLFEVLRGFRHAADFHAARQALAALPVVSIGGPENALAAAEHYRALRSQGITIKSPIDVLLASFCIEQGYALLHSDQDFDALEAHRGLRVWRH